MRKVLSLGIAACILFSCNSGHKKAGSNVVSNPLSASDTSASLNENAPQMTFEENIHNFGKLVDGEVVTYRFKFTNTGKSDLIIANTSASCGCTTPKYPKEPIAPGEESGIDVQFNSSGKVGNFEKTVTITSNTYPPQVYLVIRGEVLPKPESAK